jgi:hypothetical protein
MVQSILNCLVRHVSRGILGAFLFGATTSFAANGLAADERLPTPPQSPQQQLSQQQAPSSQDADPGSTTQHSYEYYRQQVANAQLQPMRSQIELQPMRSQIEKGCIPQATGWHSYGFPNRTFRYGWFGAERSCYPRVMWHQGYYGDETRTAYWQSY